MALLLKDWAARWTVESRSVGSRESAPCKGGRDREKNRARGYWELGFAGVLALVLCNSSITDCCRCPKRASSVSSQTHAKIMKYAIAFYSAQFSCSSIR